ncbi:MAG: hypothetical protein JRI97_02145 [Deltaproteobacteria bacterium]|nr:hypothetical protein [Deltaproteobacteria bacterium]
MDSPAGRARGWSPAESRGGPTWTCPKTWAQANASIAATIRKSAPDMARALSLARTIQDNLDSLARPMDDLCAATCPWCPEPCCHTAVVWLDFPDLLFIHLAGHKPPPRQLRETTSGPCGYLSPKGCTLPRTLRPWVCTWYLCPTQKRVLATWSQDAQDRVHTLVDHTTRTRRHLEHAFIKAATSVDVWQER